MNNLKDLSKSQEEFLISIGLELQVSTVVPLLLDILVRLINQTEPNWDLDKQVIPEDLRDALEVCHAAIYCFDYSTTAHVQQPYERSLN